jgi:pyruvate dehydrogenase E2 component (dihydrolipoamide acetyltransferase)
MTQILMPALSPTMEEGTLSKWHVKPGDHVSPGDVIAEIETDKATMDVEAVDEGVIAKLLVAEGAENVKVKTPIAEMAGESGEQTTPSMEEAAATRPEGVKPQADKTSKGDANTPSAEPAARPLPQGGGVSQIADGGDRIFASPLARRIAAQKGLDLHAVKGSGPHGRIVKADVEAARAAPAQIAPAKAAPAAAPKQEVAPLQAHAAIPFKQGDYTLQPLDGMRKTIARRMTQSFQEVPHFSLTIEVELDRFNEARKQLNARLAHENVKLSVNDILIRASALALKKTPDANVSFIDNTLLRHKHAHVAVAVAVPGGLVTPVIFEAESKGLAEISREMAALADKARARKLLPPDYEGGTFSLSNLGMYGIKSFTSILNEPQAMILSVGAGEPRPIVKNGAVAIATMLTLTLTCDHRAVDGAIGAEFLAALRGFIEDPMTMML